MPVSTDGQAGPQHREIRDVEHPTTIGTRINDDELATSFCRTSSVEFSITDAWIAALRVAPSIRWIRPVVASCDVYLIAAAAGNATEFVSAGNWNAPNSKHADAICRRARKRLCTVGERKPRKYASGVVQRSWQT